MHFTLNALVLKCFSLGYLFFRYSLTGIGSWHFKVGSRYKQETSSVKDALLRKVVLEAGLTINIFSSNQNQRLISAQSKHGQSATTAARGFRQEIQRNGYSRKRGAANPGRHLCRSGDRGLHQRRGLARFIFMYFMNQYIRNVCWHIKNQQNNIQVNMRCNTPFASFSLDNILKQ